MIKKMKKKRTPAQIAADAKRTGRPAMKNPRNTLLGVKVTRLKARTIRRKAAQAKKTVSSFILSKLLGGK